MSRFVQFTKSLASTEIHRLVVLSFQWIVTTSLIMAQTNDLMGLVWVFGPIWLTPLSFFVARLVNANLVNSILLGALLGAMVGGCIGYPTRKESGFIVGSIFGAYFCASLSAYYSSRSDYMNLFWASISTMILAGAFRGLYDVESLLSAIKHSLGEIVEGAVFSMSIGVLILFFSRAFNFSFKTLSFNHQHDVDGVNDRAKARKKRQTR